MSDPTEVQKLLRLKRYERPPAGYFEDFLAEFQSRQRAEMLRRPLAQIFFDRVECWLAGFRVPSIAYAVVLVGALGITGFLMSGGPTAGDASARESAFARLGPTAVTLAPTPTLPSAARAPAAPANLPPSYVLETRPVSYEAPFSF